MKDGGASQMMRMEDGNIVFLSIGFDAAKVFVAPKLDSIESFKELASFPIIVPPENRRAKSEEILKQLRTQIAWPKSVAELQLSLEKANV